MPQGKKIPNTADRQKAVAIKYNPDDIAPRVVATGEGFIAEKIIEQGKKSDVAIYKNKELADELTKINLGDNIPPELYEIVAQILVYIDRLDKNAGALPPVYTKK